MEIKIDYIRIVCDVCQETVAEGEDTEEGREMMEAAIKAHRKNKPRPYHDLRAEIDATY